MTTESGGYDLFFTGDPPEELLCSICLLVQKDPVLTSCCGNHFCRTCIDSVCLERRPCPLCNGKAFTTMLDKSFVRRVNELNVACSHRDAGCTWEGPVGGLSKHTNEKLGDCKYMLLSCPYLCGSLIHRSLLEDHQKTCSRRPYTCKFCDYKGVYEDMGSKHWVVCEKYPLPCPNNCGKMDIERRTMEEHLKSECLQQTVECEFAYAGCDVKLTRSDIQHHLATSLSLHLHLVSEKCRYFCKEFHSDFYQELNAQLKSKEKELSTLSNMVTRQATEIVHLQQKLLVVQDELEDIKSDCTQLKSTVFIPPFEFIMLRFQHHKHNSEQWLSPAFYTRIGGYKLCISVDANGSEDGEGTHISLYANVMKGEYDDCLKWPFRGTIIIQVLNQREDKNHYEDSIVFTYEAALNVGGRVQHGVVAESGLGISKFIPHQQLGYNAIKNTEYLKNDCLHFRVDAAHFTSRRATIAGSYSGSRK